MSQTADLDISKMFEWKGQLENLAAERKIVKEKYDEIEQKAINQLLTMNTRYIDVSGRGSGPFWVLCKKKQEGSLTRERFGKIIQPILEQMYTNGIKYDPVQLTELVYNEMKAFEKRGLCLKKMDSCKQTGTEDLKEWIRVDNRHM